MQHCMSEKAPQLPRDRVDNHRRSGRGDGRHAYHGRLEGRPLHESLKAYVMRNHLMIYSRHMMYQINVKPHVLLSFTDVDGNDRAAIDGQAVVTNDRDKIRELWTPLAKASGAAQKTRHMRHRRHTATRPSLASAEPDGGYHRHAGRSQDWQTAQPRQIPRCRADLSQSFHTTT